MSHYSPELVWRCGAELTLLTLPQMSGRQKVEASLRQLERDWALLQHQSAENLRKVEIETDRKRSLENECEHLSKWLHAHSSHLNSQMSSKRHFQQISLTDEPMKVLSLLFFIYSKVNNLRDQLEDLRKKNQNSQMSNEKNVQLQKQVRKRDFIPSWGFLWSEQFCLSLESVFPPLIYTL